MALRLGDILVAEGMLTDSQMDLAVRTRDRNVILGDHLVNEGFITLAQLNRALELQFDVGFADVDASNINSQVLRLIPEVFARNRKVVAFAVQKRELHLAMLAPDDIETIAEVELMTGYHVRPFIAHEKNIVTALERGYDDRGVARQTIVDMKLDELERLGIEEIEQEVEVVEEQMDTPVVRLVQAILNGAVDAAASDIHLEPHQPEMRVRYRVDGELQKVMTIPMHIEQAVVSRIKVMADMNTTETRKAQDGHLTVVEHEKKVNYRVSSIPTVSGEKLVLRLLDEGSKTFSLEKLGIEAHDLALLRQIAEKPHGMFIVTGPTGSGKSTTLYALLSELNKVERNIVTVEDPVEYRLTGINQVQSNNEHGMGFANALKYIMRQDPDVIMIGEIRDQETAHLATQAALTGHLMISSLHTNDATSAVVRLGDLGVDNFKIAGALIGSIAQRLVRKVCEDCREEIVPNEEILRRLGPSGEACLGKTFYHGRGCRRCLNSGYSGRTPIFEIMMINQTLMSAIEAHAPISELRELAKQNGLRELKQAGLDLALRGITTVEEVYYKTVG